MYLAGLVLLAVFAGLVAGWVTNRSLRSPGYGGFWDILIAVVGALLGAAVAKRAGFLKSDDPMHMIAGELAGAIVLTALIRILVGLSRQGGARHDCDDS